MRKILIISIAALGLSACTAREQQLAAAGVVGAAAGAVVANEMSQPRPVYVEQRPVVYQERVIVQDRYVPVPPRRPQCYIVDHRTPYGIRQERVCN